MRALLVTLALTAAAAPLFARAEITDGPSGEVASPSATFSFKAEGGLVTPAGFQCRLDGGAWAGCTSPHTVGGLGGGPHVFEVRAGGVGTDPTPARREWTVALQTVVAPPPPRPPAKPPAPAKPRPQPHRRRDAGGCAYGANRPGEVAAARLRRAIVCLVNAQRAAHDLVPVRRSAALERAGSRHVRDMLVKHYFAHDSPAGDTIVDRSRASGYLRGTHYWTLGEVLAWIGGRRATPSVVVRAWMHSPAHRQVLLTASFRDAGVAFRRGSPVARSRSGATFAMEFGRRG